MSRVSFLLLPVLTHAHHRRRPGRPDQFLCRGCRRHHHHAAGRQPPRPRPDHRPAVAGALRTAAAGYIREPKAAIEVEAYRPFFIHGEVPTPGQYAYVANMTVENAIALAGGSGPRADRGQVSVSRDIGGQTTRATVPLSYLLRPGDALRIGERWF